VRRLLVAGSCSVHLRNFLELVRGLFDQVLWLTHKGCDIDIEGVRRVELDFRLGAPGTIRRIKKIIKDFGPTHIYAHQANSYALFTFLAAGGCDARRYLNVWGSDILVSPKKSLLMRAIARYSLKKADLVTGDSEYLLKEARRLMPGIKTALVGFGVEDPACDGKKERLIYSNRLHKPLYNIDTIIRSFAKFLRKEPGWRLVVAGDGPQKAELENLCRELGVAESVEFVGFVDPQTNRRYYCKASIYVSVPQSDSVSMSLVEAILADCKVVVSDIPANREIVDEGAGVFIEPGGFIDFGRCAQIEADECGKMRKRVWQRYSKDACKVRFGELFDA